MDALLFWLRQTQIERRGKKTPALASLVAGRACGAFLAPAGCSDKSG
jgi:hypothetical protein